MLFQRMLYLSAVLSVLNLTAGSVFAQTAYDEKALISAIESLAAENKAPKCNPFIDPGCHVPVPGSNGPNGCTDCASNSLLKALRQGNKILQPDSVTINGGQIKLLEDYKLGSGTTLSLPAETGQ